MSRWGGWERGNTGDEKRGEGMGGSHVTLMEKHPEEREQQASKLVCSRINEEQKGRGERKDMGMPGTWGPVGLRRDSGFPPGWKRKALLGSEYDGHISSPLCRE